jgi:predicted permease
VILLVLAILAATAVGAIAERRCGARAMAWSRRLIAVLVWGLLPFVVFFVTVRLQFHGGVGIGLLLGYVELGVVGVAAYLLGTRVLDLTRPAVGSLVCCVILANTGYLGIGLIAQLLGHDALGPAIAFDTIVSQVVLYGPAFAVGAAFGTRAGTGPRERVRAFLTRNPVLYALAAGLLAPEALSPDAVLHVAEFIAAYALLPIGFVILGVNLMAEEEAAAFAMPPLSAAVGTAIALRMAVAPLLMLGLSAVVVDVPHAYLLQAAMPSGINTLVVAHVYGLDVRLATGVIAWSTALAIVAALALSVVV